MAEALFWVHQPMLIQSNAVHIPLANKSVQLCAFSPPYWGLRKYSVLPMIWGGDADCRHEWQIQNVKSNPQSWSDKSGLWGDGRPEESRQKTILERAERNRGVSSYQQGFCHHCNAWWGDLGLEPTPELYLAHMMQVMAECWRVLRDDGVCFVNIGDSYNAGRKGGHPGGKKQWKPDKQIKYFEQSGVDAPGIKAKSLCLIPQKFAIKCQEQGWIFRNEIIWHKPNPMPSSAKDRCTVCHEQVWFMSKSNKTLLWKHRDSRWVYQKPKPDYVWVFNDTKEERSTPPVEADKKNWKRKNLWAGYSYYWDQDAVREPHDAKRVISEKDVNRSDYKPGQNQGYYGQGFVTRHRDYNPLGRNIRDVWTITTEPTPEAHFATWPSNLVERMIRAATKPGDIVLDPFCGTAKSVIEAGRLNRTGVGLDLSWEYLADIAQPRLDRPIQRELAAL